MKILWFLGLLLSFSYNAIGATVTPSYTALLEPYTQELKEKLNINLDTIRKKGLVVTPGRMFFLRFGHMLFRYSSYLSDQNKKDLNSILLKSAPTHSEGLHTTGEIFQKISVIAKEAEQRYQSSEGIEKPEVSKKEEDILRLITKQAFEHIKYDRLIKQSIGIDLIQTREKGLSPLLEKYFLITFKPTFSYPKHLSEEDKEVFQNILEDLTQIKGIPSEATLTQADAILKKGFPIADKISGKFIAPSLKRRKKDVPKPDTSKTKVSKTAFNLNLQHYRKAGLNKLLEWKLLLRFGHVFFKYSNYFSDQDKKELQLMISKLTRMPDQTDSINLFKVDEIFQMGHPIAKEIEQRYQSSKKHKPSLSKEKKELLQLMNKQADSDEKAEQDLQIKQDMGIDLAQAHEKGLSPLLEKQLLITFGEMFLNYHMYFTEAEKQMFQNILEGLTQIKETSPEATSVQADVVLRKGYSAAEKAKRRTVGYNDCYKIFTTKFVRIELTAK